MTGWTPSYATWNRPPSVGRVTTSRTEVTQLLLAFVVLTIDLTLIVRGLNLFPTVPYPSAMYFGDYVAFSGVAALTGFVVHEMAHKVSAQRRGYWAEFRMSPLGLLLSLFTAFFGFLFAAPGATVIGGMDDVRNWGRTSLAGPLWNFLAASVFAAAAFGTWVTLGSLTLWRVLLMLTFFNGWFATFNLIPFGPLDGRKVWRWNRTAWVAAIVASGVLAGFGYFAFVYFFNGAPRL